MKLTSSGCWESKETSCSITFSPFNLQSWHSFQINHCYTAIWCCASLSTCMCAAYSLTFSALLLHFHTAPVAAQSRSLFLVFLSRVANDGRPSCSLTRLRVLSSSAHYAQNWYIFILPYNILLHSYILWRWLRHSVSVVLGFPSWVLVPSVVPFPLTWLTPGTLAAIKTPIYQ